MTVLEIERPSLITIQQINAIDTRSHNQAPNILRQAWIRYVKKGEKEYWIAIGFLMKDS